MLASRNYVRTLSAQRLLRSSSAVCSYHVSHKIPSRCFRPFSTSKYYAAKRVSKRKVGELAQGKLEGEALPPADKDDLRKESMTQVVQNYMKKFSNCVVLTRVGNFYEVRSPGTEMCHPLTRHSFTSSMLLYTDRCLT